MKRFQVQYTIFENNRPNEPAKTAIEVLYAEDKYEAMKIVRKDHRHEGYIKVNTCFELKENENE